VFVFTAQQLWECGKQGCGMKNELSSSTCQQLHLELHLELEPEQADGGGVAAQPAGQLGPAPPPRTHVARVPAVQTPGHFVGKRYVLGSYVALGPTPRRVSDLGGAASRGEAGRSRGGALTQVANCGSKRRFAARRVAEAVDCRVLLLSKDGSHGLDLSFVTHIFLLDKIWDPALEKQVGVPTRCLRRLIATAPRCCV
jgi:hypothetical protein